MKPAVRRFFEGFWPHGYRPEPLWSEYRRLMAQVPLFPRAKRRQPPTRKARRRKR